jgi:hypothetical protein
MSKFAKWLRIIICQWLLSIIILVILVMSLKNLADYWRSANWIQVEGKIISLKITDYKGVETDGHWAGRGKLLCQYAYIFEGQNYIGERIGVETFDDASRRTRRYRQLKTQLDEDKPIAVFVNPIAPKESTLFRDVLSDFYFAPALGLMWFGGLLWNYKHGSKKCEPSKRITRITTI